MASHRKVLLAIICIVLFPSAGLYAQVNGSVTLSGFKEKIYSEKITQYKVVSSDPDFKLLPTGYQKILARKIIKSNTSIIVTCGDFAQKPSAQKEKNDIYLSNTRFLNLNDPSVKRLAGTFKKSKNPMRDIERFVFKYISNKMLGIPLLAAKNIISSRSGDCTEHAVLTIALLRSLGIPARAVVGMLLSEEFAGKKNIFVFHMWVEAYENHRWHLVDSTRPGGIHPNRYIAFTYHSLKTEMPVSYMNALSVIQKLQVYYLP